MTSQWKGSLGTASNVARQIAERYGPEAATQYDPSVNCFTYRGWKERGYQVKRGEKALHSITFVPMLEAPKEGATTKEVAVHSVPRAVYLFWKEQVEARSVLPRG